MDRFRVNKNIYSIAHSFQPNRLTLAREWKEITKQELANRINRTASAISQFESGRVKPDALTIGELAMALGVAPQFFSRGMNSNILPIDGCHFRSLRSASQKQRKRLLAMGTLLYDILSFCEDFVDIPPENVSNFSREVYGEEDIERYSIEIRRNWGLGLGPIGNVITLLQNNGIFVTMMPDNCREVNAFSTWVKGRPFIFLANKGIPSEIRFDAGHELLHLLAHADVNPGDRILENQADRFSGCFYLPRESFYKECPRRLKWEHFTELKIRWGVSYRTLIMRAFQLGCISEFQKKRAFIQLSQNNISKWSEPFEGDIEYPTLLPKLLEIVSEDMELSKIASELGLSSSFLNELLVAHGKREIH